MVNRDPAANLLKVGHHGSRNVGQPEFLAAVHPQYGVISVEWEIRLGCRRWTYSRDWKAARHYYRTDMDGAVTFFLDGARVVEEDASSVPEPRYSGN